MVFESMLESDGIYTIDQKYGSAITQKFRGTIPMPYMLKLGILNGKCKGKSQIPAIVIITYTSHLQKSYLF